MRQILEYVVGAWLMGETIIFGWLLWAFRQDKHKPRATQESIT